MSFKRTRQGMCTLSLPRMDTEKAGKRAPTRNHISRRLDLRLPPSSTVRNKRLLLKPPSRQHFVMAALAD